MGAARDYIVAVRRGGVIEFFDPGNLETVSRIHFNLPEQSVGFNGVFASSDGSMLYLEGPIGNSPEDLRGCCSLYSIDLATLETKAVAWIWGSRSRRAILISDGIAYRLSSTMADSVHAGQWHFSPDRHWLFGVRSGPAVDIYEFAAKNLVRQLTAPGLAGDPGQRFQTGAWLGDRFYLYATEANGSGRLWTVSPETTELGDGLDVPALNPDCSGPAPTGITGAGSHLFVYQIFGSKIDPRSQCGDGMAGGAWTLDPATGRLMDQMTSNLHFWSLIPNADSSALYGLSYGTADTLSPVELVRIDAQNLHVTRERLLDTDYWWIIAAPLRSIPSGDVWATLPTQ